MRKNIFTEKCNEAFANIINAVYFKKNYVKPKDLSEVPKGFHSWIMDQSDFQAVSQTVTKILTKDGKPAAYLCFWKQTTENENIPFLVQRYESAVYAYQVEKGNSIPIPVITVVLYFGKKKWKSSLGTKDILEKSGDIPEEILCNSPNYKLNLVDVASLPEDIREECYCLDFSCDYERK